jgi:hypothetical protein
LEILKETQVGPLHEEWVRMTSGLIQGIMFRDMSGDTRESCRGEEASRMFAKQQKEVAAKLQQYLQHHHQVHGDDGMEMAEPDLNACFAPYRYSLISTPVLNTIIPEFRVGDTDDKDDSVDVHQNLGHNCHFHVNTKADILQVDWKLEEERATEEEQHSGTGAAGLAGISGNAKDLVSNGDTSTSMTNLPPGFRPTKLVNAPKSANAKSGSNLFMPKKPSSLFNTSGGNKGTGAAKTLLRRKGGAQALVKGSSVKQRMASAAAGGKTAAAAAGGTHKTGLSSTTTPGAPGVGRFTGAKGRSAMVAGRSKMKMIDVQEVSELNKQHQQEEETNNNSRASKRKRILEAAQKGMAGSASKKAKSDEATASKVPPAAAPPVPVTNQETVSNGGDVAVEPPQPPAQWQLALNLPGINKMSDDDKLRVQQFVDEQYNPTPNQPTYKMKIHEQRGTDATTGEDAKETYYLELNYQDLTHKISKKVKRYN